jgi:hypothetical protein
MCVHQGGAMGKSQGIFKSYFQMHALLGLSTLSTRSIGPEHPETPGYSKVLIMQFA